MTGQALSLAQANLKISLWQVDADTMSSSELYVWLNELRLPHETTIRLHDLATYTKKVGDRVIYIGKIILIKIIEFVKAHPHLVAGVALGAAVGYLANSIPFIGPVLAPLAATLGVVIFGIAGHRVDKRSQSKEISGRLMGVAEDITEIVVIFFQLMADVFNTIFCNVIPA